jgi:predicted dehydrogenase
MKPYYEYNPNSMDKKSTNIFRRDFLKGLGALPFLGYFAVKFKDNMLTEAEFKHKDYLKLLGIETLDAPGIKYIPSAKNTGNPIRLGLIGSGWRGEQLMQSFGFIHGDQVKENTVKGKYNDWLKNFLQQDDLNVEFAGVCDTFSIHAQRGMEISMNDIRPGGNKGNPKPAKIYPTYREMVESNDIDAVVIATPDHWHAPMAIAAAKAGKHVYLEKPMTHSIEEAVELRNTIKSTGVVFQLGHENRQQMSFRIARELIQKGVLGTVSMIQTYTNRNGLYGAWIRKRKFDDQGNPSNINWKEFLGDTPWYEFDHKRYFNWHRFSEYGTGFIGNDFSHQYDCINQVLRVGIPEMVFATGGQYYYHDCGDMPDVMNVIFNYPNKGYSMTYDGTLKNGIYRENYIMGSDAAMYLDLGIKIFKDDYSDRYKEVKTDSLEPLYVYNGGGSEVDAVTTATAQAYIKGGYGPTYIDGKVLDASFLHVKEWIDAIRDQGKTSCDIDEGFDEAVTFNLANLAFTNNKQVMWDPVTEKAILV